MAGNVTYSVALTKLIETMGLENCTPEVDVTSIDITQSDINRPALQLAGFFDYFDSNRIQVIGQVEYTYMEKIGEQHYLEMIEKMMDCQIPCIVFCRSLDISASILELANQYKVPVLRT